VRGTKDRPVKYRKLSMKWDFFATAGGHFGQGQNGQNRFRKRGYCSLYINILIFIL
jgi:hypothetical protein